MSNVRIIMDNLFDQAALVLADATAIAQAPVHHLQKYGHSKRFVTPTLTGARILGDFTRPMFISGWNLDRHNISALGTIQIRGYSGPGRGGDIMFDTGVVPAGRYKPLGDFIFGLDPFGETEYLRWEWASTAIWLDEAVVVQSFEIIINDPDNPQGYIEIDRIHAGRYLTPRFNINYGHSLGFDGSNTAPHRTQDKSLHSVAEQPARVLNFTLAHLDESERSTWFEQLMYVGRHRDIYISVYPATPGAKRRDYSMLCKFQSLPDTTGNYHNNYQQPYVLREA
ncbi:hypothetical protein [Bowmanella denitrificans]|uniref:hypothetical protein n=1 Tax=Bowmanella denitrificans TaxID=366582 RepID=UPI000C9CA8E3|nr:hypothetical protein [Bowmanella denitrificans]